ncbi:hypothetical protein RRG08_039010 [Elysia crispata]|uniref:Uncharacterized protein n=1 Tax=Elysia crispata TaxID=231223 RepID=A0AAE1AUE1_9GAST|nr:hypothetical protein RRG08_039010 [Elysia crispata]
MAKFLKTPKRRKDEPVETDQETDLDSMQVSTVYLPYRDAIKNVNFGLVNTVRDEIERLIRVYSLGIEVADCRMVLIKSCNNETEMDLSRLIEFYKNDLSLESTSVRIIHSNSATQNAQALPNVGSLGVSPKFSPN